MILLNTNGLNTGERNNDETLHDTSYNILTVNFFPPFQFRYETDTYNDAFRNVLTTSLYPPHRHCEERSDKAIQQVVDFWIASSLRSSQ
ncbi:MAG: hypothetical protein LBQ01_05915 [Prevotellaceae bacterium]|jgi:hypothetical protein|nr:hypothetical protein [Prevotellaceae bacterium]